MYSLFIDDIFQYTIEEKVIERAYKKLALDALVIQQGRLAEAKSESSLSTTLSPADNITVMQF